MQTFTPYLTFDGNAREAMTFYGQCFDAPVQFTTFGEMGGPAGPAPDRIMHARFEVRGSSLMASDTMPGREGRVPGRAFTHGDDFSIAIDCPSKEDLDKTFAALSQGGVVTLPPADAPWGSYFGMLTDRFGVNWMLSHEKTAQA